MSEIQCRFCGVKIEIPYVCNIRSTMLTGEKMSHYYCTLACADSGEDKFTREYEAETSIEQAIHYMDNNRIYMGNFIGRKPV